MYQDDEHSIGNGSVVVVILYLDFSAFRRAMISVSLYITMTWGRYCSFIVMLMSITFHFCLMISLVQ